MLSIFYLHLRGEISFFHHQQLQPKRNTFVSVFKIGIYFALFVYTHTLTHLCAECELFQLLFINLTFKC